MKVLVTGGSGLIGKALVKRLASSGNIVRVIDRALDPELVKLPGVELNVCDITDYQAVRQQVVGMDAIAHLAAIISPARGQPQDIFHINTTGTFNVYQAAAEEGIRKIACASSINTLGYNFGIKPPLLHYFPIDESHPGYSTDPYSFSKQVTEHIADYFWRRDEIASVNLRMSGVYDLDIFPADQAREYVNGYRQVLEALLGRPEAERKAVVQRALQKFDQTRPERAKPGSIDDFRIRGQKMAEDPDLAAAGFAYGGHSDFWTAVDVRDVVQAFERAFQVDFTGSHALFITDSHNLTGIETESLLGLFFPSVTKRIRPLVGTESIVSIERAYNLLGYAPLYSARRFFS